MQILSAVLFLTFASEALAECGNLCDSSWWGTATNADVQAELNAGADVMAKGRYNSETPLHFAAEYGTAEVIETLVASGADVMALADYGKTQLHKAAWAGTPETIRALVAAGADVMAQDDNGFTPLHTAASFGTPANIQALLAAGADLEANDNFSNETPLHLAAQSYSDEASAVIIALSNAGADVMAQNKYGSTPLHKAAWGGSPETIKALIAAGADVMAQDASGDTPLHAAAEINGATDVKNNILALLAAGADVMVQNKDGKIPWDYAKNKDDVDETDEYTALKKATCGWGYWFKNLVGLCN